MSTVTYPVIRNITDRHKNRNGCIMPATWFVQAQFTDANLIMQLYLDNHEIATHTVTHPSLPNASEILGARKWLNEVGLSQPPHLTRLSSWSELLRFTHALCFDVK